MKVFYRLAFWSFSLVTLVASAQFAHAANKGHITLQTIVQKESFSLDEKGKEKRELIPAGTVTPGEEVIYTIFFTNIDKQPVEGVEIVDHIPTNTLYKAESAFGPGTAIKFSVDGGANFDSPENLRVALDDGTVRPATPSDYSHVRWQYQSPLLAGQRGYVRFRAIVK